MDETVYESDETDKDADKESSDPEITVVNKD